nr:DUF2877 domain-containing protein [uncultured Desulfobacter sp.]
MTTNILLTTEYALSQLQVTNEVKVHSVYRNTVNLLCNTRLLSVHPKSTPLSPIGMLTDLEDDEFSKLGFSARDTVRIDGNGFSIGDIYFSPQGVKLKKTALTPIGTKRQHELCSMIADALLHMPQNTVFCDLLLGGKKYMASPVAVYTQKILALAKEHMHVGKIVTAADYLAKLIGLGLGLTPSGDDFLCGVLAAMTMRATCPGQLSILKTKVLQKLNLTNDISAEFLRCACEGHFSIPVTQFYKAASPEEIALSFSKIGHSSGADTLNGILFVFSQT